MRHIMDYDTTLNHLGWAIFPRLRCRGSKEEDRARGIILIPWDSRIYSGNCVFCLNISFACTSIFGERRTRKLKCGGLKKRNAIHHVDIVGDECRFLILLHPSQFLFILCCAFSPTLELHCVNRSRTPENGVTKSEFYVHSERRPMP